MITSCTWDSRMPAAVILTKRAFSRSSVEGAAAAVAHAGLQPAHQLEDVGLQRAPVGHPADDALGHQLVAFACRRPGSSGPCCPFFMASMEPMPR